jgi:hypothetical protein
LQKDAIICVACGYNRRSGRRLVPELPSTGESERGKEPADAETDTCMLCWNQSRNLYYAAFVYGSTYSYGDYKTGLGPVWATNYNFKGRIEAQLCKKCLCHRHKDAAQLFFIIAGILGIVCLATLFPAFSTNKGTSDTFSVVCIGAFSASLCHAFAALIFVLFACFPTLGGQDQLDRLLVKHLRWRMRRRYGNADFWTQREYDELRKRLD